MISRIDVWHRGQAIPLLRFGRSGTNSPDKAHSFRVNSPWVERFPFTGELSSVQSAMPIRHYLQGHRFDPETARLLGLAFEMAIVSLQHVDGLVAPTRDLVAQKIIELAIAGERDPERLCDGVLMHFRQSPPQA